MSRRSREPKDRIEKLVRSVTGASHAACAESIQMLWGGYGEVLRVELVGAKVSSVIVKVVAPPSPRHRRDFDRSHRRKLRSYSVERTWYDRYASRCSERCRVAQAFATREADGQWLFVLEDLDASGFSARRRNLSDEDIRAVLQWLANFHAEFLQQAPEGLWKVGTYWHLATRPDELEVLGDHPLGKAAGRLDARLNACPFLTLVHGDAKVDNFCFPSQAGAVAAVDFQYVGGGCGMKDVAYFFESIWDAGQCARKADAALDDYFEELGLALGRINGAPAIADVEAAWRDLYSVAWADFYRFLTGWAVGYGIHSYAQAMIERSLRAS